MAKRKLVVEADCDGPWCKFSCQFMIKEPFTNGPRCGLGYYLTLGKEGPLRCQQCRDAETPEDK